MVSMFDLKSQDRLLDVSSNPLAVVMSFLEQESFIHNRTEMNFYKQLYRQYVVFLRSNHDKYTMIGIFLKLRNLLDKEFIE